MPQEMRQTGKNNHKQAPLNTSKKHDKSYLYVMMLFAGYVIELERN